MDGYVYPLRLPPRNHQVPLFSPTPFGEPRLYGSQIDAVIGGCRPEA